MIDSDGFTILHQVVEPLGSVRRPRLLDLHLKVSLGRVKQNSVCVGTRGIH